MRSPLPIFSSIRCVLRLTNFNSSVVPSTLELTADEVLTLLR
jgi:hypothetical protein